MKHHLARMVDFNPLPTVRGQLIREPFGFVDGISNPVIVGIGDWTRPAKRNHLVAPGEFILGYPDNLGFLPSTPSVQAPDDPQNILPAVAHDTPNPRPQFSTPQQTGEKDLGRNGTFLVVRQLEQDIEAFEEFLIDAATQFKTNKEWIAAKLVGRWREDGSSLVRNPAQPRVMNGAGKPAPPDNEFLYGVEDPTGLRCPYGAHIRRSNPRESLAPSLPNPAAKFDAVDVGANTFDDLSPAAKQQLAITNRHRILRVGRSYPKDGQSHESALTKPGIMFMCVNTDIERQFEFVQKTWVLGRSFHGLESEQDPMMGQGSNRDVRLTIPTPGGPLRLKSMADFVTVLGSAYFFMPSRTAIRFLAA